MNFSNSEVQNYITWKINGNIRKYNCHKLLHLEFELDAEQADPAQQEHKNSLKLLFKLLTAAHLSFGVFFPVII